MKIDRTTSLFGVIGFPLGHTLSPLMLNRAFEVSGEKAVYLAFETTDLEGAVAGMRALGIQGLSVTLPFKARVIPLLDHIDPLAHRIGAVNTIVNRGGRLEGYNTDAGGALKAIREVIEPRGRRALILGAGGAARAVGYALREAGAALIIANRSRHSGERLAQALGAEFTPLSQAGDVDADLLIQTTPVGMHPETERSPLQAEQILAPVVMDLIYNPLETRLLLQARARGARVIPGLRMFIHQGAEQFRLWTGKTPPLEEMLRAVGNRLEQA